MYARCAAFYRSYDGNTCPLRFSYTQVSYSIIAQLSAPRWIRAQAASRLSEREWFYLSKSRFQNTKHSTIEFFCSSTGNTWPTYYTIHAFCQYLSFLYSLGLIIIIIRYREPFRSFSSNYRHCDRVLVIFAHSCPGPLLFIFRDMGYACKKCRCRARQYRYFSPKPPQRRVVSVIIIILS